MVAVTVVVAARNAAATIGRALAALSAQELDGEYEVIVVDSGSTDGTASLVERAPGVALLGNPGGEPASSRNLGAARARGAVLAFTDADCEPAVDWLACGLRVLSDAEIVQGRVVPAGAAGPFDRTVSVASEYGLYETANLFVRRSVFERVGGFEPVLHLVSGGRAHPFGEDAWFAWRARRTGARTAFASDAVVRHAVFDRGPLEFVRERARVRYFPPLVALIPELRGPFLHRRWFLSPMSMRFDLALAGAAVALLTRRAAPAALAVPYAAALLRRGPRVAAWTAAADAVTFAALIRGSVHASTPVL